jgi:ribose transport system ATP-binding protein
VTPERSAPVALSMRGIGKSFPGVRALEDVSLTVHEGEVAALLGENGAGKSTLMNVLSGVFADYQGQIEVAGRPASIHSPHDAQRLGVSTIYQELNLVPEMSVADNIFLGRELLGRSGAVNRRRTAHEAAELLASVGLTADPRRLVRQCRVAERQLIEVAKALSLNVRVLVMDEPTSALADAEVQQLFEVIRGLTARGVGVVYISHRLEELEQIADSVTVLRDGRYVGRRTMADTSRQELIAMMVGRPLQELYQHDRSSQGSAELLNVEELTVRGDPRTGRAAVSDVSLRVRPGEIVGLAGLMGAGRTETLEAIYGAYPRSAVRARITVSGRGYRPRSPAHAIGRGIALVAEDRKAQSLVLGNTVRFNTSLASLSRFLRWGWVDARRERQSVTRITSELGVKTPSIASCVGNLSGGNQQKVVLAKCLLTKPDVILMDEPTRGIDVGAKAEIYDLMNRLAADGAGILVASSELPELLAMCDRILVLCEGRVTGEFPAATATQEAILDAAMRRQVVVGEDAVARSGQRAAASVSAATGGPDEQ